MAEWNMTLNVNDAFDTGELRICERFSFGDEEPLVSDDTISMAMAINRWLMEVLKPYQYRNLCDYMNTHVELMGPEDKE